ncbi:MAG: trypsin-like peptidase domain-containing protein [Myxococcus sp.]|nr:trypsin-like peptidase domain-containing protein [Myxococcus sp.]
MWATLALAGLVAVTPEARQELFSRLKRSVVVLEVSTTSGQRAGNGTGFVIREDGLVVTNQHVVEGHRAMTAVFADGRKVDVTGVLLLDEAHDLAVIRIDATGLEPLELGTSADLKEGTQLFMAGNPLGLDFTFNEGVLTALRTKGLPADLGLTLRDADKQSLLQLTIDAEPGSSGSPIVDAEGRVVGIERAGFASADFAVPVDTLKALLTDEVLATEARPLAPVPWLNLGISAVVLTALALFLMGRLRAGGRGTPRAQRRFSGYEE